MSRAEETMITWDPTTQFDSETHSKTALSTFLRAEPSRIHSHSHLDPETQLLDSQDASSYASDASSIARFPDFHFNLHSLTTLSALRRRASKVNVLLVVLEVDGPDLITIKKGADAGKQIYVLKMILGDEDGAVCRLTAWRDVAEMWGGVGQAVGIKRGDIVHLENVSAACDPDSPVALTASPHLKSKAEICYRSMPRPSFPEDRRLRPDLRLGFSDAAVRRVAAVVAWFEKMAGLGT
ncbi:hypothetical protein FA95DRAFT_1611467 [Auriscalpium vulgare]|uniref:Uncharacterized protein n=1 Tax=Auriscalpium vulgare TaxID=40419 RepID=A0ACB8RB42_9AGAM|nr:hypothetical protein FA95DRAFT_1611467 [Auriscalpium vulgare]